MHLVVGSTGLLGNEICRRLSSRGAAVRALVRSSSSAAAVTALQQYGVDTVIGDLQDAASLRAACNGISAIVTTATATRPSQPHDALDATDRDGTLALVDAAVNAGVKHVVQISVSPNLEANNALVQAKRLAEEALQTSGLEYSILQPSFFMDVWLTPALGFDYDSGHVAVLGDGSAPISWIHSHDVAEFAVRCALGQITGSRVLALGGPQALSPNEVCNIFQQVSGRRYDVMRIPVEAIESEARTAKAAGEDLAHSFAELKLRYIRGDSIPMADLIAEVPMPLQTVSGYAKQILS